MRYPVGGRPTLAAAINAARESVALTKMRYRVEILDWQRDVHGLEPSYWFGPDYTQMPDYFTDAVML